ncbi:hypothetical protein IFR05_010495 [Cadophora sp. M221]|nr:hypothetical protein IFR05_010495 [Cadophora sp. M221]
MYNKTHDPENPMRPLKEYEKIFAEFPDYVMGTLTDVKPIEVVIRCDVRSKVSSVGFIFEFNRTVARIGLSIWLGESDITTKEPLREDDSEQTFDRFWSWLSECVSDHRNCSSSITGEPIDGWSVGWDDDDTRSAFPTRLLDVGQSEEDLVRLVETHTEQGPYIALSHCWGHETRRPKRTTNATLKSHLNGVPFTSLPNTFQDAVKICRELQSAYMGTIYENARLTIAASSARDSTEGFFLSERQYLSPLGIYCGFPDGSSATTYFAALPAFDHEPYYSQLGSRAWACQEWYLSRRMIFSTKGGFSWKFNDVQFNERRVYYDMHEQRDWTGTYTFGTWTNELPKLLFWMRSRIFVGYEDPKDIPSWSWASRAGSMFFWTTEYQFFLHEITAMEGEVDIREDGSLGVCAPVQKIQVSPFPNPGPIQTFFKSDCGFSPESTLLKSRYILPIHYIHSSHSGIGAAVGLAAFDENFDGVWENVYAVTLLTTTRLSTDPLWIEDPDCKFDVDNDILICVPDRRDETKDQPLPVFVRVVEQGPNGPSTSYHPLGKHNLSLPAQVGEDK